MTSRTTTLLRHLATAAAAAALLSGAPSWAQDAAKPAASAAAPAASAAPAAAAAAAGEASEGKVAFYGRKFAGRRTASGERFNPNALTMAHKSLPFGTLVKVTHAKSGRSVVVRVNDRGPTQGDRIGDLSYAAAAKLRILRSGVASVKLEVVGQAKAKGMKRHQGKPGKKRG